MASNAFANVKGKVFTTDHREGFAKESGAAYSMDILSVLVIGGGLTEVVLPGDSPLSPEALASLEGKEVDFTVEFFRNARGFGTKVLRENSSVVSAARAAGSRPAPALHSA